MSTTIISIEEVVSVEPHPNADRLDVIKVLGYQVIVSKGTFKVGDHAVYFPPDIMIPEDTAVELGVDKYLKHGDYDGKCKCRVAACRLRGLPSYGFCLPLKVWCGDHRKTYQVGADLTYYFEGRKYVPPVRLGGGDCEREAGAFYAYTSIENVQRCPELIPEGTEVVVTEKIHGTNCRMGLVRNELGTREYMAGSHKVRRKSGEGLYWHFFTPELKDMCLTLSARHSSADVILYGEIYGPGIQDMKYGQEEKQFRIFDISVNGEYLDHCQMVDICNQYAQNIVPVLFAGQFTLRRLAKLTDGTSVIGGGLREGVVVKPMKETTTHRRIILKSVSVDYLNRRDATDEA